MTICLIVTFYKGKRAGNQGYLYNKYINAHLNTLKKVKNNLDAIYFVINSDNLENEKIVNDPNNPKIKWYYRNNKNLSFGSWVDVMNKTDYDNYILCEDDYLFVKDNFDTILLDEYNKYNSDFHVLWRTHYPKEKWQNLKDNGPWWGGGICTIGILSNEKSKLIDKNYNNVNMTKGAAMYTFLKSVNSISYTRNTIFPYYAYKNDSIQLYINNDDPKFVDTNSKRNPKIYNNLINIINGNVPNPKNIKTPILACYQFVEKHYPQYLV